MKCFDKQITLYDDDHPKRSEDYLSLGRTKKQGLVNNTVS